MKTLLAIAAISWALVYSAPTNADDLDPHLYVFAGAGTCNTKNLALPTYQQRIMTWYGGPRYHSLCDTGYVAHVQLQFDYPLTDRWAVRAEYDHYSHPEQGDAPWGDKDYTTGYFNAFTVGFKFKVF